MPGQNRSVFQPEQVTAQPWVIIGCGYTGERLARRLRGAGADVWVTRRSARAAGDLAAALGVHGRAVDLDDAATLHGWLPAGAVIIDSAPPGTAHAEENLVDAALGAAARRIVYLSSTSVYPPGDGSWVDEDEPVDPQSQQGAARLRAESALLSRAGERGLSAVSLRIVGIYGPGRGVPARLLAGTYRVVGEGDTYVNRIHVDDLASAIMAAALIPSLPRSIYNVSDDQPETSRAHADAVADILGIERPPSVPESVVEPWVVSMLGANRRVSNVRMKEELRVTLSYPTWREGLQQILTELGMPVQFVVDP